MSTATAESPVTRKTRANSAVLRARAVLNAAERDYADAAVAFGLAKRCAAQDGDAPSIADLVRTKTRANSRVIVARAALARAESEGAEAHIALTVARLVENERLDAADTEGD